MKLQSIQIQNYRSIEDVTFDAMSFSGNKTYALIGINEAGKTSILKAISLKEKLHLLTGKDFRDKEKPVEIIFKYQLDKEDLIYLNEKIISGILLKEGEVYSDVLSTEVTITTSVTTSDLTPKNTVSFSLDEKPEVRTYLETNESSYILGLSHKIIFWTAEQRYLISDPINLSNFAGNPESISIPLLNCFKIASIVDIKQKIAQLNGDSTEVEALEELLGSKVTEHIKNVWGNHKIKITFKISDGLINFHIKDEEAGTKSKTVDQRSDGFKQFISFLLTISAQSKVNELTNTIILLDEPETHLHPQAQEFLLGELIKITEVETKNIIIFATHSNYMIDRNNLNRCYRVLKENNDKTSLKQFVHKDTSYNEVNYEVFNIISNDYFIELYGHLHSKYIDEAVDENENKERCQIKNFDQTLVNDTKGFKKNKPWKGHPNEITLVTYIRNCIHHPNGNDSFSLSDLEKSIKYLRFIKYGNE